MPVSTTQLAGFADTHGWRIPFDTSPRHLAGPGDARHVTHGLAAAGWKRVSDPLSAEIVMRSPDTRYSLHFDPQTSTSAWWRLESHPLEGEPLWYATFGELVPAEILAAVTDALIAPRPAERPDVIGALKAAGWRLGPETGQAHSPDGLCHVEQRHHAVITPPDWHIAAREPGFGEPRGPRIWHATFDGHTPADLVHAFVTALADPAPLQRGMHDRTAHYSAVQEPSPLTPEQVVAAHANRLDALRTRARAARRRHQRDAPPPAPAASASTTRRR